MTEGEISLDKTLKSNPCTTCQQVIYETAFSGKFKTTSVDVHDDDDYADDFEPDDLRFAEMIETETYAD